MSRVYWEHFRCFEIIETRMMNPMSIERYLKGPTLRVRWLDPSKFTADKLSPKAQLSLPVSWSPITLLRIKGDTIYHRRTPIVTNKSNADDGWMDEWTIFCQLVNYMVVLTTGVELECLATWKDGADHFAYGNFVDSSTNKGDKDLSYRCLVSGMQMHTDAFC